MTLISSLLSAALIAGSLLAPATLGTDRIAGAEVTASAAVTESAEEAPGDEIDEAADDESPVDETPVAELPTELSVEIVPSSTGTVSDGSDLSLVVRVENNTGETQPRATAVVVLDRDVATDRDVFLDKLESPSAVPSPSRAQIARTAVPSLDAGTSIELDPIVLENDELTSITSDAFGAHVVSAEITSGGEPLGAGASVVTIDPGSVQSGSSLALAMPLTVPVTAAGLLDAETLASYTEPDGLLSNQLDEVGDRDIAVGIDPRIIASIRALGVDAPESATAWLERLREIENETFPLAYGDSDISATSQAGSGVLGPVGFDLDPARFDDAPASEAPEDTEGSTPDDDTDTAPGSTPGSSPGPSTSSVPDPSPTPSVSPDGSSVPSTSSILAWDYSVEGVAWPRESSVVTADLATFTESGLPTTILDSASVAPDASVASTIPSTVAIGEHDAVVSDDLVSDLLRDAVNATTTDEWRAAMARLTGALALVVSADPDASADVFATFDRNSGLGVYRVEQTARALAALSWLDTSTLSEVRSQDPVPATLVESPVDSERLDRLADLAEAEASVVQFATVLDDPLAVTADSRLEHLALASQEWATDLASSAWPTAVDSFVADSAQTVASVQLASTTDFVLAADNAALPIPIVNELDVPATVYVTVRPQTGILDVQDPLVEITVPPGSQTRALVPVRSVANGQVLVNISLASGDGVAIGSPTSVEVDVRAGWDTTVTTVLFILVVLVFVLGIIRTIRRIRRREGSSDDIADDSDDDGDPDATPADPTPADPTPTDPEKADR
ncbi:DUF6049 family protein [Marisediminicola sp. LYQ134]|uniref:DUF6049 family protein n=1 Tax=Marisediminicola sp. LYQ134 TaxID=3391061 RepID=UPI0039836F09